MTAETTIEAYYDALRTGDPLPPFFDLDESNVKFGIGERLVGEEIGEGLREQTRTTREWTVESHTLRVTEHDDVAWFSDRVRMAWTDDEGERHDHETRWSGTLVHDPDATDADTDWRFVGMHVSLPGEA
ncbi:nuclear transport factor 2 family protein [Halococcus hamelinensis]|uniref:SnoaL-like domain-containing protein n=1 Tax=Halococcus hamelinensis 100A6 TaxID=1132509 RepID=M0M714_9EURY|nr:nuclear transport factor 2 family protein [Halococcus hamelinensis]EMA41597.1 hypothetical protein C447_02045 [Halococcus hamelinensis 100A6]